VSPRGFFITFEGPEGSGKSTHSLLLCDYLKKKGCKVLLTREPGGDSFSEKIRDILLDPNRHPDPTTELLLYLAARREHIKNNIIPALRRSEVVICPRFSDATVAYQGYGRGLPLSWIQKLDGWVREGLAPDLTLLLDIPVGQGLARARGRHPNGSGDRLEQESPAFHDRVRKGYLALAKKYPSRIKVIKQKASVKETFKEVVRLVEKKLRR